MDWTDHGTTGVMVAGVAHAWWRERCARLDDSLGAGAVAHLDFTPNLRLHVECPAGTFEGSTVREVLERAFHGLPAPRGYVLDDQGAVRKHVMVFVNGEPIADRQRLSDPVGPDDHVFVMQALSGG